MYAPNRPTTGLCILTLVLAPLLPSALSAQSGTDVRFHLAAGVIDPRGAVPDAPILASSANGFSYGDVRAIPALAGGIEIRDPRLPLGLRVSVTRSIGGEGIGRWGCLPDPDGTPTACPSILGLIETDISTTVGTAAAVARAPLGWVTLTPTLGVAWMRYAYRWRQEMLGSFSLEPGAATDHSVALQLGIGMSVAVRRFEIEAQYAGLLMSEDVRRPDRTGSALLGLSVPF